MKKKCELCNLAKDTEYYYSTPAYMIVECKECEVPMVVLREHSSTAPRNITESMEHNLLKLAAREYGLGRCRINHNQVHSAEHLHYHVQPI